MSNVLPNEAGTLPEVDFDLTFPGDPALPAWEVLHLSWTESLSHVHEGSLVLACAAPSARADDLLGRSVTLTLSRGHVDRRLHGVIHEVDHLGASGHHRFARVSVASALWFLGRRVDSRVFQNVNTPALVADVLRSGRLPETLRAVEVPAALRELPPREYCVQYRESDLAFVSRLLEDEGIPWRLVSDAAGERFVMLDAQGQWPIIQTPDGAPVPVGVVNAATFPFESVRSLRTRRRVVSTGVRLSDHDFTHPSAKNDVTRAPSADPGDYPVYEHPAGYIFQGWDPAAEAWTRHDGPDRARIRGEEIDAEALEAHGTANVVGLEAGRSVVLAEPDVGAPVRWHIVSVAHEGHAWADVADEVRDDPELRRCFEELGIALDGPRYANRFRAVHEGTVWRPRRETRRPTIYGPQTATVRAQPGSQEEIATDAHGRVLVEFHWDHPGRRTPGQRGRATSCWVRVAQVWAGSGWGFSFVPRVGMEVVVQFGDGDPDRPLVVGCVYNGENRSPEALPDARTRSVIRTRSTPGGAGYNELSFEDLAGDEQVRLHAQRDLDEEVRHDHVTRVGHDRVLHVGQSRSASVVERDTLDVGGDRVTSVGRDESLTVEGDMTLRVQGERGAQVSVDAAWVLVADREITLECGTSRIVMGPDRISITAETIDARAVRDHNIEGGMVNINCDDEGGGPTRSQALRDQMMRLGMEETVAEMERHGTAAGLDARRLWKRTSLSLHDWLAEQPDLLRDRLVLRAGVALAALLRDHREPAASAASSDGPGVRETLGAVHERFREEIERVEGERDAGRLALFQDALREADRSAREAVGFALLFQESMVRDPAWRAMQREDADGGRVALEQQARIVARQRVLAWSDRHEAVAGSARATRLMASATRRGVQAGLEAGLVDG